MKKLFIVMMVILTTHSLVAMNQSQEEKNAWVQLKNCSQALLQLCKCHYLFTEQGWVTESYEDEGKLGMEIERLSKYLMSLHTPESHLNSLIAKKNVFTAWTATLKNNTYYFSHTQNELIDECLTVFEQSNYMKAYCPTTRDFVLFNIPDEERTEIAHNALRKVEMDIKFHKIAMMPQIFNPTSDANSQK